MKPSGPSQNSRAVVEDLCIPRTRMSELPSQGTSEAVVDVAHLDANK